MLPFSSLPLDPNGPPRNAWGLFGLKDELGMLNLLTPEVVAAAAKEIKSGIRISLDLPLDRPLFPSFDRTPLQHEVRRKGDGSRPVNDDTLSFNTQSSSQWDGFRHYGYLKEQRYFNGRTNDDIDNSKALSINDGILAENGGITGRGVLLDYADWAARHSIDSDHFTSSCIPLEHLKSLVVEQGISFRPGDILFIRAGFTVAYDALSIAQQEQIPKRVEPEFMGLESSEECLRWFWENQFAAVASDAPSLESAPVGRGRERKGMNPDTTLHQWMLAGWGTPIGELFDLEGLAEYCRKEKRWSFFVSSVPLKVPGGVASPPNAVAIF